MLTPTLSATSPRRLTVERPSMTIEGHALDDVVLGGWAYGPELGHRAGRRDRRRHHRVAVSVRRRPGPPSEPREAWWPALFAPDLIDPTRHTVLCPCWPGNGSTWRGFDDGSAAVPAISVLGLADLIAAWLDGCGCTTPVTFVGASLGGMVGVAFAVRHPERCAKAHRDLRGAAAGRLGHGDAAPAARARARRPAQRRRRHRHEPRAPDRHAHLSRPRRARHALRPARARTRTAARGGVSRTSRPAVRRDDFRSGRSCCSAKRSIADRLATIAHALRAALERVSAETIVVGVPGDMLFPWALQVELHRELQAAGAESSLWKLRIRVRPRRVSRRSGTARRSAARRGRVRRRAARRRAGRGSKASASSRCASCASAWSAAAPSAAGCSR